MKYITLIIGLLVVGCGKQSPDKELTAEEKVIGTYECKDKDGDTYKRVFLENGVLEGYRNGKKEEEDANWKITAQGEIHLTHTEENFLFRINKDRSLTWIAIIGRDGRGDVKRIDFPKEDLDKFTLKKFSGIRAAISNWVDDTNISIGIRIFLVIVLVSLMIWNFKRRN